MYTKRRNSHKLVSPWRISAVVFLFVALFCQLSVRISVMKTAFEIEQIRQGALASDLELRQLDLEYASVSRPADIRKRAGENLQLIPVDKEALRHVSYVGNSRDAARHRSMRANYRSNI